jgi:hypothetical protein
VIGLELVLTCEACPEQYDLRGPDGEQLAYFRLRSGRFTVEVPDVGGEVAFFHEWPDDPLKGMFDSDAERAGALAIGIVAALRVAQIRAHPVEVLKLVTSVTGGDLI